MNIFRLLGDLSHLSAIILLLLKIWKTRSCAGISGKSQILFLVVFVTRYLDLVTNFVSVYNTVMKVSEFNSKLDYFSTFGIDKSYNIEIAQVAQTFKDLQRQLHPDKVKKIANHPTLKVY
mgnify:CR=1 FL=1